MALAYAYETRPRWCKTCNRWKPPRSHHCSMMGACVLKMDHFCVWMGNTVGLLNYKSFVLFHWWTFLGCAMSAVMFVQTQRALCQRRHGRPRPNGQRGARRRRNPGVCHVCVHGSLHTRSDRFLVMHWSLMARNMTTIEAYEKQNVEPWPWNAGTWRGKRGTSVWGRPLGAQPRLCGGWHGG